MEGQDQVHGREQNERPTRSISRLWLPHVKVTQRRPAVCDAAGGLRVYTGLFHDTVSLKIYSQVGEKVKVSK